MVKRVSERKTQERAPSPVITRRKTLRSATASTPAATAKNRRVQKVRAKASRVLQEVEEPVKRQHRRKATTARTAQTENKPPKVISTTVPWP